MRRILVYKNGASDPAVMGDLGCYERFFARALRAQGITDVTLEVHNAFEDPRHPLRHGGGGYDGLWLSGSPRSLVQPEPWMTEAAALVREAAAREIPILGVCFGHQLVAWAFGAEVRQNPAGWEAGTRPVRLTPAGRADPLFRGLGGDTGVLLVNQSHRDEVAAVPTGATVLAESDRSPIQSLAIAAHIRTVQFHPEFDGEVTRRLVRSRRAILDEDARAHDRPDTTDALLAATTDTPESERILSNWLAGL